MRRIYRPWAAGRESQLFAPATSLHDHCPPFLYRHVAVKRLPVSVPSCRLVPSPRRTFTKSCSVRLSSQAAQPSRDNDDEPDDIAQQYTGYRIDSFPNRRPVTDRPHFDSNDHLVNNSPEVQTSSSDTHLNVIHEYDNAVSPGNDRGLPVNEEEFAGFSGFWPSQTSDPSVTTSPSVFPSVKVGSTQSVCSEKSRRNSPPFPAPEFILGQLWEAQPRHGKIDLSYWNPVRGELQDTYSTQPKLGQDSRSTGFRYTGRSRLLVAHFVQLIYPHVSPLTGLSDSAATTLSTHPTFTSVEVDVDVILSVFSWSWIVVAPPALRVKRLIHWSRSEGGHVKPDVPQWLVLQLLRTDHVDSRDLVDLLSLIDQESAVWDLKRSMMILIVRLLRRARDAYPACFSHIIELFMRLLDQYFPNEPPLEDARRRAHWCNRILTLLALPVRSHPFKHVIVQQDAQLLLLHYMHDVYPAIPLNREGYRALAKLQLMHAKTDSEKMWAEVQAETWPPWEQQHQMGVMSPPRASPGSTSRTNLVLRRMRDDGYSPHTFDIAAQILGGRDSDGSPTAQVRRPAAKLPSGASWLPGPDSMQSDKSAQIWVARITATRTVREAWMAFCAYENAIDGNKHAVSVYHAMFEKLWAYTVPARSDTGPLPGDGLENFADPELARDRVHVPEEPPSAEGLYDRMTAKGIKPSGRLLRDLLLRETDLHRGLLYITDSAMKPQPKLVLANPLGHSPKEIALMLNKLHADTSEAYISLLTRPHSPRSKPKLEFRSDVSGRCVPGPVFAFRVLQQSKTLRSEYSPWATYFAALSRHGLSSEGDRWRISMRLAWKLMCDSYALQTRRFDASALPHVLLTARSVQTWASWSAEDTQHEPLYVTMKFFVEAISGVKKDWVAGHHEDWPRLLRQTQPTLHSVPTADAIQDMAFLMVAAQQGSMIQDILHLLRWTHEHQQLLATVSTFTRRNLAAFRVYLEGQWAICDSEFMNLGVEIIMAQSNEINEAKEICHLLGGWASDEDVSKYLLSSHHMFVRLKHKLKCNAQIA